MRLRNFIKSFPSLILAGALLSCAHNHSENHEEKSGGHDHHNDIVMSVADASRFGVEVEEIQHAPFTDVVKVFGEILPASSDQSVVSAPTSGIVTLAKSTELGGKVTRGQLIATISSAGMVGGDANKSARTVMDAAKRELDRLEPLLKDGIVTKKDYNEALAAYEAAKSAYSPSAASGRAVAGISGVISNLLVNDGAYVDAGQPIATVASSSRLTLKALLPAGYIDFLPQISSANIKASHGEGLIELSSRNGKLLSSSASGGSTTPGYIPVYFSFDNHGDVVPGTPAEIYLVGNARKDIVSVPLCAVSEQQGEKFVYVLVDDHAYRKQNVKTGRSDGNRIEILSGVNAGDSVVTEGSTFVRLAETSTVVPEGHSHSH